MKRCGFGLLLLAGVALAHDDNAINCGSCAGWNQPQAPFNLYGNSWYVGTAGLSAVLVTSAKGHILLDGALPQSAAQIEQHIAALGFRIQDVKLIVNSHAHFDHAGGIAALQKASGAVVAASAAGAQWLRDGAHGKDDPQYDARHQAHFPPVAEVKVVRDGEVLSVGDLRLTAHLTPGHTPGGTTWSWRSCEEGRCVDVVYADSLTPISAEGFRFSGDKTHPDISGAFKASIAKVEGLRCDIVVSVHPDFTGTFQKLAAKTANANPFLSPGGCREYAKTAAKSLTARLNSEQQEKTK
jgi:metallo-beta-lactamase class B